jgi:hypothetical protein
VSAPRSNRLQPNLNRDPATAKKNAAAASKVRSAKAGGGKKGTFVGQPNAIHIHIVGRNTHVQVGGDRCDFDNASEVEVKRARKWLSDSGATGKPGYTDCLTWLGYPKKDRV